MNVQGDRRHRALYAFVLLTDLGPAIRSPQSLLMAFTTIIIKVIAIISILHSATNRFV